jgi:hypothetical protein
VIRGGVQRAIGGIAALALLGALSGCASIISGRQAEVAFDSHPSHAHVVIRDKVGREVAALTTPGVVSLKRNRRLLMPAYYTATIESPGYAPAQVPLRSTINPWILGNVIVGGVPGLIVDTATGALWKPRQSEIHQQLVPQYGSQPNSYNSMGADHSQKSHSAAERMADNTLRSPDDAR